MVEWGYSLKYFEAHCHFIFNIVEGLQARAELQQNATKSPYISLKAKDAVELFGRHVPQGALVGRLRGLRPV